MARSDLTGKTFGRLTVISPDQGARYKWICKCECGNIKSILHWSLTTGNTKSCGCIVKENVVQMAKKHGLCESKLYGRWKNMRQRCTSPKDPGFRNYGGRGIKVCDEWMNSFESFQKWAEENGYDESLELDRIDVNGDYEPSNCRFVTKEINNWNKRTTRNIAINGVSRTIKEWSELSGIRREILESRFHYGWEEERLLNPVITRKRRGNNDVQ